MDLGRSFLRVLFGRFAIALAVAFPLVLGGVVGVNFYLDWRVDQIPRVKLKTAQNTDPGEPANFLLIGSDTRAFVQDPGEQQAYGNEAGQRSDTLMVVHVDPRQKTGFVVSFPRDMVVNIPGLGQSKINAAFNSGAQRVVDTLQQNFNIPIHHYVEVDFNSFEGIVDAMGGVPLYIRAPARDAKSGFEFIPFNFHPGCYTLSGNQALTYVRSRDMEEYIDGGWQKTGADAPDLHRIERQQTFMKRLATEAFRQSVKSPRTALDIADKTIPKLKADEALSRDDINKLITSFRRVDPNDPTSLEMVTLPTTPGPRNPRLGDVLEAKQPEAEAVLARLRQFGPTPDQQRTPKPPGIRVQVFNGSGQSGLAAKTGDALQNQGFVTVGVGNKSELRATEVRYRPGSQDKAAVVQGYLGGVGKPIEDSKVVEADVEVVLGKDFKAVAAPAGATPASPATTGAPGPGASVPPDSAAPNGKPGGPAADPTQC